jgi:hypothetical protein
MAVAMSWTADRGVLVLIGYSLRSVSADFETYPLLDVHTGRTCEERAPPCVIGPNIGVGDTETPHPLGQVLTGLDRRTSIVGAA